MPDGNVQTLERIYAGWSHGDFTAGAEFVDDDFVLSIDPDIPDGGKEFAGPEGVREYMSGFLAFRAGRPIRMDTIVREEDALAAVRGDD
jgi:SnoaL-like domain